VFCLQSSSALGIFENPTIIFFNFQKMEKIHAYIGMLSKYMQSVGR
jgi:hypothetical protein